MKKNKYFLFLDLNINNIGVVIKNNLSDIDSDIIPLILLNTHKFSYYVISESYTVVNRDKTILIDSSTSVFYFKLFLKRDKLHLESYARLMSLSLGDNLNYVEILAQCIASDYSSYKVLSLVFFLLALNKVMAAIEILNYAKSLSNCVELNKWYKKVVYDYSDRHEIISSLHSNNVGFLINKANTLYKENDFSSSVYYFEKLVFLHGREDYTIKLGLAYRGAYEFDKAMVLFNRYINSHPEDYRGYYLRGLISLSVMKYSEAKEYYEISISRHPFRIIKAQEVAADSFKYLLGSIKNKNKLKISNLPHFNQFRLKSYIEYTNLNMTLADIHNSLGEYKLAANIYYKIATSVRPDLYLAYEKLSYIDEYLFNKAVNKLDKYLGVIEIYVSKFFKFNIANKLKKYIQSLYVTRGRIYILQLDRKGAERSFKLGKDTHSNIKAREWLAYLYLWSHRYEESLVLYKSILEEKPNRVSVIINLIRNYLEKDEPEKAGKYIDNYHNLLLKAKNKDKSHLVRRNYYYSIGDITHAWLAFRDRKICDALLMDSSINYTHSVFESRSSNNKVLVLSEWGPGDELRWASVYPEVKRLVTNLTIGCEPRLFSLFQRSFPNIKFIPTHKRIRGNITVNNIKHISKVKNSLLTQVLDSHAYHIAQNMDRVTLISDVLGELRKDRSSFIKHSGLLNIDPEVYSRMSKWLETLPKNNINIGICWKSGLVDVARSVHYSELGLWKKIFELNGVNFVNLQYSNYEADLSNAKDEWGVDIFVPSIDLRDDFESVAALMKQLDLVISPATAVVELAGMVGVETLLFSNSPEIDWRVLDDNSDLWHSSINHIRATRNQDFNIAQISIVEQIYECISFKLNQDFQ